MLMMGFGDEEGTSSESEWEEEETTSSSEEGLVVDEDEDFGLPEMVIFVHEPIYRVCKEVMMDEKEMRSGCLRKCVSKCRLDCLEKGGGERCGESSEECGCDELMSNGCGDDEESCGSGIVSYDERMNVYKKVILVRDVEEVIHRIPTQIFNQVGMRDEAKTESVEEALDQYAAKESFYFESDYENGLINWNFSPRGNVQKLQSLKELMSMTSQVDDTTNTPLSPPPVAFSMKKSDTRTDLSQPCSGRHSFSFPILAKEWFGSPVRMADNSNKLSPQGILRYFRCCSF